MPDLHARIKALAEMERPCLNDSIPGKVRNGNDYVLCPVCDGTSRIALFKVLRVPVGYFPTSIPRRWLPEPDVEKACWRILQVTGGRLEHHKLGWRMTGLFAGYPDSYPTPEEAVISAAGAWAKEAQRG